MPIVQWPWPTNAPVPEFYVAWDAASGQWAAVQKCQDDDNIAQIEAADEDTLLEWEHDLNNGMWPVNALLPVDADMRGARRRYLRTYIANKLGDKKVLWYRNTKKQEPPYRMTEEEFDDWWRGHREGGEAALERCKLRNDRITEYEHQLMASAREAMPF